MKLTLTSAILLSLTAIGLVGCTSSSSETATNGKDSSTTGGSSTGNVAITGAGSTFVAPAMTKWAYSYKGIGKLDVNYQGKGSGAGISQYSAGNVEFGATDAPLSAKDLKDLADKKNPTAQFPVVSGCVALVYNLPGIESGLKLDSDTLADIFLGTIKKWNDPKIVALNPTLKLPDMAIAVAHRSDGSGTTFMFTDYLSSANAAWKAGPNTGKTVNWPVGVGGNGSDGVAGSVKQTAGGIGYVEFAYAIQGKLTFATLKNKAGNFVAPSIEGTASAAAAAADALKKDITSSIVNQDGKDSYPITGMTYVILSEAPKDKTKSAALVKFLEWALTDGQAQAKDLQYAPLPPAVVDLGKAELAKVDAK